MKRGEKKMKLPTFDELIGIEKHDLTDSQRQDCRGLAHHYGFERALEQADKFQEKNRTFITKQV